MKVDDVRRRGRPPTGCAKSAAERMREYRARKLGRDQASGFADRDLGSDDLIKALQRENAELRRKLDIARGQIEDSEDKARRARDELDRVRRGLA